jgi:hypothetical protein
MTLAIGFAAMIFSSSGLKRAGAMASGMLNMVPNECKDKVLATHVVARGNSRCSFSCEGVLLHDLLK